MDDLKKQKMLNQLKELGVKPENARQVRDLLLTYHNTTSADRHCLNCGPLHPHEIELGEQTGSGYCTKCHALVLGDFSAMLDQLSPVKH